MYLTTLDPISRDFDRIVRRAFGGSALGHGALDRPSYAPALPMDTVRRDGEVVLRFDVPGVDQDKIDVTVDKGVLTVSATREETKTEGENPVVRERLFGSFTRRVRLSDNLDAEAIEASHPTACSRSASRSARRPSRARSRLAPRARPAELAS